MRRIYRSNLCWETISSNWNQGTIKEEASDTSNTQPDLLRFSQADEIDCNIVDLAVGINSHSVDNVFWTLFFDGLKTLEGSGAGCVLIDPHKKNTSCPVD